MEDKDYDTLMRIFGHDASLVLLSLRDGYKNMTDISNDINIDIDEPISYLSGLGIITCKNGIVYLADYINDLDTFISAMPWVPLYPEDFVYLNTESIKRKEVATRQLEEAKRLHKSSSELLERVKEDSERMKQRRENRPPRQKITVGGKLYE